MPDTQPVNPPPKAKRRTSIPVFIVATVLLALAADRLRRDPEAQAIAAAAGISAFVSLCVLIDAVVKWRQGEGG